MASSRSSDSFLPHRQHASSVLSTPSTATPAGPRRITLTIPPLRLKATNSLESSVASPSRDAKTPNSANHDGRQKTTIRIKPRAVLNEPEPILVDSPVQDVPPTEVQPILLPPPLPPPPPPQKVKIPRPIKLKPLREVLGKLMVQIKRKDDYAFFLHPVDPSRVPGYSDVVKYPMDLGTMTEKIERGRFRSLEEFKNDFLLVTGNAKAFNPPETLYHIEATRLESYGLDHIAKASAHVIEYETDWTVDVVEDVDPIASTSAHPLDEHAEGDISMAKADDDSGRQGRSPSVMSSVPGAGAQAERKRPSRAKKGPVVTESWEEGGHLPGFKDGLGVFPPLSDLAALMLELKLKGKKFRTKKERMKREKEGPPMANDGSLAYSEIEHPFTFLRQLVPDPPSRPNLVPLVNIQSDVPEAAANTPAPDPKEASQPPEGKEVEESNVARGPVFLPPDTLPSILPDPGRNVPSNLLGSSSSIGGKKLRHWTITRNPSRASRIRDGDDGEEGLSSGQQAKRRRIAETTDYGVFASLPGTLAAETGLKTDEFENAFGTDEKLQQQLRTSLQRRDAPHERTYSTQNMDIDGQDKPEPDELLDADEYITDVVYGGIDGFAYIRSLAEFVGSGFDDTDNLEAKAYAASDGLRAPLRHWIETNVIDPLTNGNHSVLREISCSLSQPSLSPSDLLQAYYDFTSRDKTDLREALTTLVDLADPDAKVDIATLLKAPEELFVAESEWVGATYRPLPNLAVKSESEQHENGLQPPASSDTQIPASQLAAPGGTLIPPQASDRTSSMGDSAGVTDVIDYALLSGAHALLELDRKAPVIDRKLSEANSDEDPLLRRTRLNLIAIAKRAPIEKIAHLPPNLVPPHIRHIVPTLSS